jgi:hypothetical protein
VVVVANNEDLFWIAKVTYMDDKKIALCYYHYIINWNDKKIYKLHNSTRSCRPADLISHFFIKIMMIMKKSNFYQK